jgi:hypothetical protein
MNLVLPTCSIQPQMATSKDMLKDQKSIHRAADTGYKSYTMYANVTTNPPSKSNPTHPRHKGKYVLGWQTGLWSTQAKL